MLLSKPTKHIVTAKGSEYAYWRCYYRDPHGRRKQVLIGRADGPAKISFRKAATLAAAESAKLLAQPAHLSTLGRGVTIEQWVTKFLPLYAQKTRKGTGATISATSVAQATEAGRLLVEHFGKKARLSAIDRESAREFRRWLGAERPVGKAKRLRTRSEGTIRTMLRYASIIFTHAAELDLVPFNPFDREELTSVARKKPYIPAADVEKIIAALPKVVPERDAHRKRKAVTTPAELSALIACCRYGGLRCEDDTHTLRWSAIDWGRNEMLVESGKTGQTRMVPIEPRLATHLLRWFENTPAAKIAKGTSKPRRGADLVFRVKYAYAYKLVESARDHAKIKPWPSLFHALRASAATDLKRLVGESESASILGHSATVSRKHYGQEAIRPSESAHTRITQPQ